MARISNRDARGYVQSRENFTGSNIHGSWDGSSLYTVYSYGDHFPMYIWDDEVQRWFGNEDKYSVTTSKHQNQCLPTDRENITWFDTAMMKKISRLGFRGVMAQRVTGSTDWHELLKQQLKRAAQDAYEAKLRQYEEA